MTTTAFTTERLIARRWTGTEVEDLLAVYGDADAMRWVGDGKPITRELCVKWLEVTRNNYEKRGYGMLALEEKGSGRVVGFCGLVHPGGQEEAEVKYAFLRSHWGQGLATEAVLGLISHGRQVHGLARVMATAAPANLASHRVLLKAGFVHGPLRGHDDGSQTQVFVWQPRDP